MLRLSGSVDRNGSCKAVVIRGAGRASLEEIAVPAVGPEDVAVRVAYAGVCVTDLEIFKGTLGYYRDGRAKYPIVPGHEVSGHVASAGRCVKHLSAGEAVVVECIQGCGACRACRAASPAGCEKRAELGVVDRNGGYAEFVVVPARFVQRVPAPLDLRKASLCEPLAVALKGIGRLARAWGDDAPKRCAVVGAGPLGRLCAKVLAGRGHAVALFDRDARRLSGVGSQFDVSRSLERLGEFDALVEATGRQRALDAVLGRSRAGATVLLLGLPYGRAAFSFEPVVAYDKTIVGSVGSGAREFAEALALLPALDTSDFEQSVLPLEEFRRAWELARTRARLKVMLAPEGV